MPSIHKENLVQKIPKKIIGKWFVKDIISILYDMVGTIAGENLNKGENCSEVRRRLVDRVS